jgi:CBS domain-containing protein
MKIGDIMNINAARIRLGSTLQQAAEILRSSQASDLMVEDQEGNFVGVLSEGDLIRAALPQFDELLAQGESLSAGISIFVDKGKELAGNLIDQWVIRTPVSVAPQQPVLKAATVMISKQIRRLPVVDNGRLVGSIARSDICLGILSAR